MVSPQPVDLVVSKATFINVGGLNGNTYLKLTVKNTGSLATGAFTIAVLKGDIGGRTLQTFLVSGLGAK